MSDPTFPLPESVSPGVVTAETPQLQVDPSKLRAIAISVGLALMATLGGATTILSYAKNRDLAGIVGFAQSSAAVPFFGGLATLAGLGGIGLRTFKRKSREIYLAWHVRERIAVVTKEIDPPKPPAA